MDIDVTYLVQMGILLIALVSLSGILLKPMLSVIVEREAKTEGATADVDRLMKEGDAAMETYQTQMRETRVESTRLRGGILQKGRDTEKEIVSKARKVAADDISSGRNEVLGAEKSAIGRVSADVDSIAKIMVEKLLGAHAG